MKHECNYELEYENSVFVSNLRKYKCKCGKEKMTYQIWGRDEEVTFSESDSDNQAAK